MLQSVEEGEWIDLYAFDPAPMPFIDVETSNWYTCTNPRSPFTTSIIVSAHAPDGRRSMLRNWDGLALKEQTPSETTVTPVEYRDLSHVLSTRFDLTGFAIDREGRLVPPQQHV